MSFAEYFASAAPRGFALPEELHRALDFLESAGHGEAFDGEDGPEGFLSVSADPVSGAVFYIDFDLTGYLDTDKPGAERLVPVVDPDGGGSRIMAWAGTDGTAPYRYLFLGAEGEGPFLVAENTVDLLRLLAVGYAWIGEDTLGCTPAEAGADDVAGHAEFRDWVTKAFGVDVPASWPAAEIDREAADWLVDMRGDSDEGLYLDGIVPEPHEDDDSGEE